MFASLPDTELLGYGVPAEWLPDVRNANEDTLLGLADHLPKEAAEALLDLATGATPQVARPVSFPVPMVSAELISASTEAFEHPDA